MIRTRAYVCLAFSFFLNYQSVLITRYLQELRGYTNTMLRVESIHLNFFFLKDYCRTNELPHYRTISVIYKKPTRPYTTIMFQACGNSRISIRYPYCLDIRHRR